MQKKLSEAGDQGFEFVGMTVAKALIGGDEVVWRSTRTRGPAAFVVRIYAREGHVEWPIPPSIRR